MAEVSKGWHCRYSLKYHIVWVTKRRFLKFFGQVEKDTKECFKQIASDYDWDIEEMEIMPEHVHLYVSTEPTDRPCDVVKKLKEESSKQMGRKYSYPQNKKKTVWARGYFISSVNDKTTSEQIKKYIRNQKIVEAQGALF